MRAPRGVTPSKSHRPDWLERLFLRDCAFVMRLDRTDDTNAIWVFGVFSLSSSIASFILLLFMVVAVFVPLALPTYLHPLTAPREIALLEGGILYVLVGVWVDYRFAEWKTDVSAARRFMRTSDLVKWWLLTMFTAACLIGVGVLVVGGSEGWFDRTMTAPGPAHESYAEGN